MGFNYFPEHNTASTVPNFIKHGHLKYIQTHIRTKCTYIQYSIRVYEGIGDYYLFFDIH